MARPQHLFCFVFSRRALHFFTELVIFFFRITHIYPCPNRPSNKSVDRRKRKTRGSFSLHVLVENIVFLSVLITSLGRRFPVSKAERDRHWIHARNIEFVDEYYGHGSDGPQNSKKDEQKTQTNIKPATQKGRGKKNIITEREKLLYGTTCFLRFYGAYIFCFFKKKKGDLLKRNFQCYTIGFFFVCWTRGQTPGLSGIIMVISFLCVGRNKMSMKDYTRVKR